MALGDAPRESIGRPTTKPNKRSATAFVEVAGRRNFGCVVWAVGWDDKSVILKVLDNGCDEAALDTSIQTYRLPKGSHAYDHLWTTEFTQGPRVLGASRATALRGVSWRGLTPRPLLALPASACRAAHPGGRDGALPAGHVSARAWV